MKVVIQRVTRAQVTVEEQVIGSIGRGFLIFVGFTLQDDEAKLEWMANKIRGLRIFEDNEQKMNLSLLDVNGQLLVVSQFTLYADASKGRRPSFVDAAEPKLAQRLYDRFCEILSMDGLVVQRGQFGALMQVELVNDGPVTILIER